MKTTRRIFAVLLSVVLVAALGASAFAAEPGITVSNAVNGETYTAYKLLGATYDDALGDGTAIAYYYEGASTDALYGLLTGAGLQFQAFVDGKAYLKVVDEDGIAIEYTEAQIKTLASSINAALAAGTLTLTPAGYAVASGGSATIDVTEKGLYFVDTTLGSVCSIDTAGSAEIYEKNTVPTLTKEVQEDSDENWYTNTEATDLTTGFASAQRGEEVLFRLTVNTGSNTHSDVNVNGVDASYVIVDTLPDEMTYVDGSAATTTAGVTVNAVWDADAGTLTITLSAAEVAALGQDADIVITYSAILADDAAPGTDYVNTAVLTYKQQSSTSTALVKTYQFFIEKTDEDGEPMEGVTFTVTMTETVEDVETTYYYDAETGLWTGEETEVATDKDGLVTIAGVDDGVYTVTETGTLPGYNMLDGPIEVTVAHDGTVSGEGVADGTLTIVNYAGTVLPSTGGVGTTIFYILGSVLVLGAVVVLVAKRRANG